MSTPVIPEHRLMVHRLAEKWAEMGQAPPMPSDRLWRGSQAGKCGRQIAHQIAGDEPSNPISLAGHWVMGLGSAVHEMLAPAIQAWAGESNIKVIDELDVALGEHGWGHADLVIELEEPDRKVLFELKTINGFGYKKAVIDGGGPRHMAKLQAALYAEAVDADLMVIGYLAMENVGVGYAKKAGIDEIGRFASEWHYTRDEYLPWAKEERERLEGIALSTRDDGVTAVPRRFSLSDPDIPHPAEITDPKSGAWKLLDEAGNLLNAGKTWQCNYCAFQDRCVENHLAFA